MNGFIQCFLVERIASRSNNDVPREKKWNIEMNAIFISIVTDTKLLSTQALCARTPSI